MRKRIDGSFGDDMRFKLLVGLRETQPEREVRCRAILKHMMATMKVTIASRKLPWRAEKFWLLAEKIFLLAGKSDGEQKKSDC